MLDSPIDTSSVLPVSRQAVISGYCSESRFSKEATETRSHSRSSSSISPELQPPAGYEVAHSAFVHPKHPRGFLVIHAADFFVENHNSPYARP